MSKISGGANHVAQLCHPMIWTKSSASNLVDEGQAKMPNQYQKLTFTHWPEQSDGRLRDGSPIQAQLGALQSLEWATHGRSPTPSGRPPRRITS